MFNKIIISIKPNLKIKLIQVLIFILAVFLPLQTPLVVILTKHSPLPPFTISLISLWKEFLVFFIILLVSPTILRHLFNVVFKNFSQITTKPSFSKIWLVVKSPIFPLLIWLLTSIYLVFSSLVVNQVPISIFALGYRYEMWWLGFYCFMIAFLGLSSKKTLIKLQAIATKAILIGFGLSSLFVLISIVAGQTQFLQNLGYANSQINQEIGIPACHLIDYGFETCRLSGGFATPIHYAGYLLLVLPVLWNSIQKKIIENWLGYLAITLNILFIFLSVSRFAMVSLFVILSFVGIKYICLKLSKFNNLKRIFIFLPKLSWFSLLLPVLVVLITVVTIDPALFSDKIPVQILKPSSTSEHRRQTLANIDLIKEYPNMWLIGAGLGYSGAGAEPNVQDLSKNPLVQNYGYIADRWFIVRERIVVAENWFLQVLVNGGFLYLVLYLVLVLYPVITLYLTYYQQSPILNLTQLISTNLPWLSFYAIITGNLMLGLFANQTIALYWTIVFITLCKK
jgi:hypothetical protein